MPENANSGSSPNDAPSDSFVSKLEHGRQRFLAYVIEHALATGRRTPQDFMRHFPTNVIMEGLAQKPSLRAAILAHTTGLKKKIAIKKTWESAAADLQIALEEGETDAAAVVTVFEADDRVRYLDAKQLWSFLVEGDFWKDSQKEAFARAKQHVAFMITRALTEKLITHRDVVDGITVAELAQRLPKTELGKIIEGALSAGQRKSAFTEAELLGAMPLETLVEYIPLPHLWETVVAHKIAEAHGYSGAATAPAAAASAKPFAAEKAASEDRNSSTPPKSLSAEEQKDWVSTASDAPPSGGADWVAADGDQEVEDVSDEEISDDDFAPST